MILIKYCLGRKNFLPLASEAKNNEKWRLVSQSHLSELLHLLCAYKIVTFKIFCKDNYICLLTQIFLIPCLNQRHHPAIVLFLNVWF